MRIAVLANLKDNAPTWDGMPPDQWDDLDSPRSVNGIIGALQRAGHETRFLEASIAPPFDLVQRLQDFAPDLCFNIAESHFGNGREAHIPSILEMLRIPYTGSKVVALALSLDKPMTKRVLRDYGLPTPAFQVFDRPGAPVDTGLLGPDGDLRFPLFVKPSREGTSMGITANSTVHTVAQLRDQVTTMLTRYRQPVLVERFVPGREVMIGIVGNIRPGDTPRTDEHGAYTSLPPGLTMLPPLEVKFDAYAPSEGGLYTNRMKTDWAENFHYFCPAPLAPETVHELFLLAATVFRAIDCADMARVDFRLDEANDHRPTILEVNPLPGLSPGLSDLCLQASAFGWSYDRLIRQIVAEAAARQGLAPPPTTT